MAISETGFRLMVAQDMPGPSSCDGCGACCTYVGTPPGYAAFFPVNGGPVMDGFRGSEDHKRFKAMPAELRQSLRNYYREVWAGRIQDRSASDAPCLWYDEATRRCKHHEYRPDCCREFEIGGDDCRRVRELVGITVLGVPVC